MRKKFAFGSLIYSYYGMCISESRYTGYTQQGKRSLAMLVTKNIKLEECKMATVGQALTAPEAGWKRIDDFDTNFSYISMGKTTGTGYYQGTFHYSSSAPGHAVQFSFTGSKLRVICTTGPWSAKLQINIDGIVTDISINSTNVVYQCLVYETTTLSNEEHYVTLSGYVDGTAGNDFQFDAIDIDSDGEIKPYNPAPISTPTNLIAQAGDSKVTLSWTAVSGGTGYNVKRSTTAGGPYTTIATNVTGASYVDTSVTNGTTYYYVITAVDGNGNESANSNEASATPQASSGHGLLRITMNDSSEREYQLSTTEIDGFINWVKGHVSTDPNCYMLNKIEVLQNSKEYLMFEKIISFEVIPLN
jgi:hypothetical protein